jgi:hypothetical protein
MNRKSGRRWLWAVIVPIFWSIVAQADPWDFGMNVDVGVVYTDNIFLADDGLEESEAAVTLAPEFFVYKDSERLQADVRYRPEAYFYNDLSDANGIFHVLDAMLNGEIVRDRLFLALDAAKYQSIVTPDGRIPTSNLPITNNRVDSTTIDIRPSWRQPVGEATMLIEAGVSRVGYDDDSFQSSDYLEGHFRLDNIQRQQGLAWAIDYRIRNIEYDFSLPYEHQRASLNLGYWVGGTLRLFVEGGSETPYDNFVDSKMDSNFWEAGFQYKPNQRLNLELAAGDRSFGESFRGSFVYVLRRGNLTASYNEIPTTRSDQAFNRRPITDPDYLDDWLDLPGESDRYIRNRADISLNIELANSDLIFRIYNELRDLRTTADGTPLPDEEIAGATIRWNWNIASRTTLEIEGDVSERDEDARNNELLRARIGMEFEFTPRLTFGGEVVHSAQTSKGSGVNYSENHIYLYVGASF